MRIYIISFITKNQITSKAIMKIIALVEKIGVVFDIQAYGGSRLNIVFYIYIKPEHLEYLKIHLKAIIRIRKLNILCY